MALDELQVKYVDQCCWSAVEPITIDKKCTCRGAIQFVRVSVRVSPPVSLPVSVSVPLPVAAQHKQHKQRKQDKQQQH